MFERFTSESREALTLASAHCRRLNGPDIDTGYLLLGILQTAGARVELEAIDVDVDEVCQRINDIVTKGVPAAGNPPFTPLAKKALELSLREALQSGSNVITITHLLRGLLRGGGDGDPVVRVLAEYGVTLDTVIAGYALEPGPARRLRRGRRMPNPPQGMGPAYGPGINRLLAVVAPRGGERSGSHHLLLAMAGDEKTMAGRVLADLGVTPSAIYERIKALGTEGTVDDDGTLKAIAGEARRMTEKAKGLTGDARKSAADILRAALEELEGDGEDPDAEGLKL